MAKRLFTVKGPGGSCVMNEEQAREKEKKDGYEIVGLFEPNRLKPETEKTEDNEPEPEAVDEPAEDSELLAELKSIRSNTDLADFIEENEIEVDPAEYDGFKELKEAVAEIISD